MGNRIPISKLTRFEVFKRDKFICQYCGKKAPDVVLNVDHIDPVAEGGGNDLINLITSCFECNNGKRDKRLSDSSMIDKQRKQLEILQERREQLELMLEWKKSLSQFDNDVLDMVVNYINNKIAPHYLNASGSNTVSEWLKKFAVEKILDGIDDVAKKYLVQEHGKVTQESAEQFLKKVPSFIVVKDMPPLKQKVAYIKGICRNRLSYWDDRKGAILLSKYIKALQDYGWSDEEITEDLEKEVIILSKEAKNWSHWRGSLEKWIEDINNWVKPDNSISELREKFSKETLINHFNYDCMILEDKYKVLSYFGKMFQSFDEVLFSRTLDQSILYFISQMNNIYKFEDSIVSDDSFVSDFVAASELMTFFEVDLSNANYGMLGVLSDSAYGLVESIFAALYYPAKGYIKTEVTVLIDFYLQKFDANYNLVIDDDLPF